jgi:hypothetical protein
MVMRHEQVHVRGWQPSPELTQISLEYLTAAHLLGPRRSWLLEARRALPGQYFTGPTTEGALSA